MADKYVVYFFVTVIYFSSVNNLKISKAANDYNELHLKDPLTQTFCANRDVICRSNDSAICGIRRVNGSSVYKDFRNHCYLFFKNVCGIRGEEFFALTDGSCENYLALRRNDDESEFTAEGEETKELEKKDDSEETTQEDETIDETREETTQKDETIEETNEKDETINPEEKTEPEVTTQKDETTDPEEKTDTEATTEKDERTELEENNVENENDSTETTNHADAGILRGQVTTVPPVTITFEGHPCPHSCPKIYSPVCFSVNKGYGKYFKLFYFINHCTGVSYYCKHPEEFKQPPGEEVEDYPGAYIITSSLDYSFCAAYKYINLARFAEVASSFNHYGWLLGNEKYSHIMQRNEKWAKVKSFK